MSSLRLLCALALLLVPASTLAFLKAQDPPAAIAAPSRVSDTALAKSGELRVRQGIHDRVKALVDAQDFVALNQIEQEYQRTRARTPSGVWKLGEYHGGVKAALAKADGKSGCAFASNELLKAWTAATPSAPAPYLATATMLLDRAWCFRGEGFAATVSTDAWKPFHENMRAAEKILLAHKEVAAQDPEFYLLMEDIYRAEGRDRPEFQKLLDEAAAKEPYYYGLYGHAYYYNQPQWSGSTEAIEAAARYAVERTRKQDGLGAYARYYWSASAGNCICWAEAIDLETMKLAMRDVAQRHPDPWNLANFAKFGCEFNDREVARHYFDALGQNDGSVAWSDTISWQKCRSFAGLSGV